MGQRWPWLNNECSITYRLLIMELWNFLAEEESMTTYFLSATRWHVMWVQVCRLWCVAHSLLVMEKLVQSVFQGKSRVNVNSQAVWILGEKQLAAKDGWLLLTPYNKWDTIRLQARNSLTLWWSFVKLWHECLVRASKVSLTFYFMWWEVTTLHTRWKQFYSPPVNHWMKYVCM